MYIYFYKIKIFKKPPKTTSTKAYFFSNLYPTYISNLIFYIFIPMKN